MMSPTTSGGNLRGGIVDGTRRGSEVVLEVVDDRMPALFAALCSDPELRTQSWQEMGRVSGYAPRRKR